MAVADFGGHVLGRPIEVLSADDQNKPDIAGTNARRWIDEDGVVAIVGGGNSSTAAAILSVAREKLCPFMIIGAGNPEFTRSLCCPVSTQWAYDTYSAASSTGRFLSGKGGAWFFITADYAFGLALERDVTSVVTASGGKVVGSVKVPLNTADWSAALLAAQASGADTIGLAIAGTDLIGAVKQAGEFGLTGTRRVAAMIALVSDIVPMGVEAAQGLIASEAFYWDRDEASRAWTARWTAQRPSKVPNMFQAYAYSAALHYLRAVQASGSVDGQRVVAAMKATPVEDFNNHAVTIRADGRVMNPTLILRVKKPSDVKARFDVFEVLGEVSGAQLYRPADAALCPLVAK
jgi:branched-chain amino acid transport system substrate-binding protein